METRRGWKPVGRRAVKALALCILAAGLGGCASGWPRPSLTVEFEKTVRHSSEDGNRLEARYGSRPAHDRGN